MFRYPLVVALLLVQVALAQQFSGSFADPVNGVTINLQQAADGSLQGMLVGPSGQWPMQGNTQQLFAAGVVQSQQGILGFQAQLSQDGQVLQVAFYEMDANGQPVGQGQALTLQRQAGSNMGGAGGGAPAPGGMGGFPAPPPGAVPTNSPPPGYPQAPGGQQPGFPQAPGGQQPGFPQMPGNPQMPPGASHWNGTFVGNNGGIVLMVQGSQGAYGGYLQYQGQQYQFQAHLDEQTLHGGFMAGGAQYEFWADRIGTGALLYLGDSEFELQLAGGQ